MLLETEIGLWEVHFRHTEDFRGIRTTTATLHRAPCENEGRPCHTPALYGEALCNPSDQFRRDVGRKLALQRCMDTFDRTERTAIWKAYWKRIRGQVQ